MGRLVDRRRMTRLRDGRATEVVDSLAVEEPLTVRINGVDTATTMRTPGHDIELALGWLVSEGIVRAPDTGRRRHGVRREHRRGTPP